MNIQSHHVEAFEPQSSWGGLRKRRVNLLEEEWRHHSWFFGVLCGMKLCCPGLLLGLVTNQVVKSVTWSLRRLLFPALLETSCFCWLLISQQQASVSQGWICLDNFTCCHTEIEVADKNFHLTQSQYTDTRLTSSSTDPVMPGTWQGSCRSLNFEVTGMTRPRKIAWQAGFKLWIFRSWGGCLNH